MAVSMYAVPHVSAADKDPNTYDYPNGLTVKPLPYEYSALESLLDMKVWKFAVRVANPKATDLVCQLELREQDKPTKVLHTLDFKSFAQPNQTTESEVMLSFLPMTDGKIVDSLSRSEEMKLSLSGPRALA